MLFRYKYLHMEALQPSRALSKRAKLKNTFFVVVVLKVICKKALCGQVCYTFFA